MGSYVLVWDLETAPDLPCVARVNGLADGDDDGARAALGDKFPKLPFHQIACIGALVAERINGAWNVRSSGAPHRGERSEPELLQGLVDRRISSKRHGRGARLKCPGGQIDWAVSRSSKRS